MRCDFAVDAIGFVKKPFRAGIAWPDFDNTTGRFIASKAGNQEKVANIRGLFGTGIAFPEKVNQEDCP